MTTTKDPHPKPDAFWDDAAAHALGGILASGNSKNAAMNAAGFADALVQERSNRVNSDVALNPTSLDVPAAGISLSTFDVTVGGLSISWVPTTSAPSWVTIIDPKALVQGDGKVSFAVAANEDSKRTATIDIEAYELSFTVDQDAALLKKAEADPNNPVPEPTEPEPPEEPVAKERHPVREVEHGHFGKKKH